MTLPFCSAKLDENVVDSNVGTRIYQTVYSEGTLDSLVNLSRWAFLKGIPDGIASNRDHIKRLQDVSVWDVSKAARFYFEDFKHQDRYLKLV